MKNLILLAVLVATLTACSTAPRPDTGAGAQERMRQIVRLEELAIAGPGQAGNCNPAGCVCTGVKGCMDLIASGQCPSADTFHCENKGGQPSCVCGK